MKLTNEDVQEILRLLDATGAGELHVESEEFSLSLRRAGDGQWTQSAAVKAKPAGNPAAGKPGAPSPTVPPPTERSSPATHQASGGNATAQGVVASAGRGAKLVDVHTPLPGTFYRAPQPGAPAFVEVGSEVRQDTVVCIVETMKLMNSIHAGVRGRVAEICLENGTPAEQNAVLMRIEPAAK